MVRKIKEYWNHGPSWARVLFWIFLGISTALIVGSFFVPPTGIIDPSILAAVGEIQGFASIGVGLECVFAGMEVTLSKGDTQINVSHGSNCDCDIK